MRTPDQLNALRAFEASARHLSFSEAARDLGVTPAAVGQLVKTLEDTLGVELFHRATSGKTRLAPSDAARRALPEIREGFEQLRLGVARLKEVSTGGVLTVSVSPAFAAKWLLPRIDRFQAESPDIDVRIDASIEMVDYAARGIDLGVRYGQPPWPGLVAEKLMDEEIFPVAAPALIAAQRRMTHPRDLAGVPLVHDSSVDARAGFTTWQSWLAARGADDVDVKRGLRINNSAAVLQAAIEGRGAALARSIMAHDDIAAGRLVRLFPRVQHASKLAYFVAYRREVSANPRVHAFRAWLHREALSATS